MVFPIVLQKFNENDTILLRIETLETLNIEVSDIGSKILRGKSKCFHPVMIGDRLNRTFEK